MAIPLFVLKTLPLRRREMYAIAFILFLGLICIVASIVRFIFLWDFIYGDHQGSLPSQQNIIVYTSELEVVIAVWAGCLPALRALLRRPSRNGTSVSETGLPSSMFSNGGTRGAPGVGQGNKSIAEEASAPFSPNIKNTPLQSPSATAGNPVLGKGYGYGGYDPERDSADKIHYISSTPSALAAAATQRQSDCAGMQNSQYRNTTCSSSHTSRTLQGTTIASMSERGSGNDFDELGGKFSIDSERDGSEVELRNIVPLSPRGFNSRR